MWIALEGILVVNVFSLHFFNVKKFILIKRQYFGAIVEKHSVRIVTQNVSNTIFWTVVDPLFYWNIFNLLFFWFRIANIVESLKRILSRSAFHRCMLWLILIGVRFKQYPIELICKVCRFLNRRSLWVLL